MGNLYTVIEHDGHGKNGKVRWQNLTEEKTVEMLEQEAFVGHAPLSHLTVLEQVSFHHVTTVKIAEGIHRKEQKK